MRTPNLDRIDEVRDWFLRTYAEKEDAGNAKVMLFDGHPATLKPPAALFVIGGRDADYSAEPEGAWEDFFAEWEDYLRDYGKKFTISIGHPNGGYQKKMKVVVSRAGDMDMPGVNGMAGLASMNGINAQMNWAKMQFDNYRLAHELEAERNARNDSRVGRLLDNLVDIVSDPQVINGIIAAFTRMGSPGAPTAVASQGFADPAAAEATQQEVTFRSKFADYGEAVRERLYGNETLVFQVMDNLLGVLSDQEKINKLINYVHELNRAENE